jgi:hypothetical protein
VATVAYSQLTFKQLVAGPRLFISQDPLTPRDVIERDCQEFANKLGYACFIADQDGVVLAYSDPK